MSDNNEKKVKKVTVTYEDGTTEEVKTDEATNTTKQPVYLKDATDLPTDKQYIVEG